MDILIFSLLVLFSETQVVGTEEATASAADTVAEPTWPEPEIPVTVTEGPTTSAICTGGESSQLKGLQFSGEAAAVVEETFSSIADMVKELS